MRGIAGKYQNMKTQTQIEYLPYEEIQASPKPPAKVEKTAIYGVISTKLAQIPIPAKKDAVKLIFNGSIAVGKIGVWGCYWVLFIFVKTVQVFEATLRPKKRKHVINEYDAPPPNAASDWRPSSGSNINVNVNVNINQAS